MNDELLKGTGGGDYWKELLDRIRDIRSSEKVMYRQVLELYATSIDYKKDSLELVINMMIWKKIHHMPVIDNEKELVGLLSWHDLKEHINEIEESTKSVENFMVKDVITTTEETPLDDAKKLMKKHEISCLPVIRQDKLIGIITSNDF